MYSLEKLIRQINKVVIKSSIDVSDIIPSDTFNILTKDESSIEKQLFNYFTSDSVSIFNKLYTFSRLPIQEGVHFSELAVYLNQTKDLIESKSGGRFDLLGR